MVINGFTLDTNDGLDAGYALGRSDEREVGITNGAPLGSSVSKTVGSRVGKVLGTIDG